MKRFVGFYIGRTKYINSEDFYLVFQSGYEKKTISTDEFGMIYTEKICNKIKVGEVYILEYGEVADLDLEKIIHLKSQKIIWEKKKEAD